MTSIYRFIFRSHNPSAKSTLILAALMMLTRNHAWASFHHLPDASIFVFFMLGFTSRSQRLLGLFLALGVTIDLFAIEVSGVSGSCLSPAYLFFLLAQAMAWFGGGWLVRFGARPWLTRPVRAASILALTSFAVECCASGGFYALSGYFPHPTLAGFGERLSAFYPQTIQAMFGYGAFWVACEFVNSLRPRSAAGPGGNCNLGG